MKANVTTAQYQVVQGFSTELPYIIKFELLYIFKYKLKKI